MVEAINETVKDTRTLKFQEMGASRKVPLPAAYMLFRMLSAD